MTESSLLSYRKAGRNKEWVLFSPALESGYAEEEAVGKGVSLLKRRGDMDGFRHLVTNRSIGFPATLSLTPHSPLTLPANRERPCPISNRLRSKLSAHRCGAVHRQDYDARTYRIIE